MELGRLAMGIGEGTASADTVLAWTLVFVALAALSGVLGLAACFASDPVARRLRGLAARREAAPASAALRRRAARPSRMPMLAPLRGPRLLPALIGCALTFVLWRTTAVSPGAAVAAAALGVYGGLILPRRWLARRRAARRDAVLHGLPDALDMMVVCVEAGMGLDAALARVGTEVAPAHPALGEAFAAISRALRAGRSRAEALHEFARRTGAREASAFAALLAQAGQLGTGVAEGLRVLAEEMREARLLDAEERAHGLPVKLTIPLVVCILPALIAVVLLPGIVTIVRDVLPHLGP